MGSAQSEPLRYGHPMSKEDFNRAATKLMEEHHDDYVNIDHCVNDTNAVNGMCISV